MVKKMAASTVTKTQKISDLKFRDEESLFERLDRLSLKAKKGFSLKVSTHNNKDLADTVESKFARSKAKALETFLLHAGTFHY